MKLANSRPGCSLVRVSFSAANEIAGQQCKWWEATKRDNIVSATTRSPDNSEPDSSRMHQLGRLSQLLSVFGGVFFEQELSDERKKKKRFAVSWNGGQLCKRRRGRNFRMTQATGDVGQKPERYGWRNAMTSLTVSPRSRPQRVSLVTHAERRIETNRGSVLQCSWYYTGHC